ncbi:MAG: DUF1615 domain-containing protein [Usitatibacter sp.]
MAVALLAGCAANEPSREPPAMSAAEARALVASVLPRGVDDREGWATDIYAAMAALGVPPRRENICAIVAVTEQESGFHVDPVIPGLPAIAWKEIERQRERAGIPKLVLYPALKLASSDGRSYEARIDAARTEKDLSDTFEDLIGRVPLAKSFLEDRNPVRTAGPMQVSVAFAKAHSESRPYPYPMRDSSWRHEVFTRRGGIYFGTAHLFDYPASYDSLVYRFADFNAGQYASRNAAFQKALADASGIPLDLDGDLVRFEGTKPAKEPGATELAARVLARRIGLDESQVRHDLELGDRPGFEKSRLYARVFEIADRAGAKPAPRAVVPQIVLHSSKITRKFTTDGFARRVEQRHRSCMARGAQAGGR